MIDHDLLTRAIAYGIADALPTSGSDADTTRLESIGAALRRGWDSAAPSASEPVSPAPTPAPQPDSGYATIATLRARVAELEAQVKSVETADDPRDGVCLTGDGVRYGVHMTPGLFGALCVTLEGRDGETKIACVIPRVDILAALGIRGDL
jgi:hypothetical protein